MKLWKQEGKEGAYREFLDATDFALVGGDINDDGSFRRHHSFKIHVLSPPPPPGQERLVLKMKEEEIDGWLLTNGKAPVWNEIIKSTRWSYPLYIN
ncbi:hypothetical protein YC2023_017803 [Brassica napus]